VLFITLLSFSPKASIKAEEDPGYYITNYEVNIIVQEDGVYVIEEKISVFFTIPSRGIYRIIPTSYDMIWTVDGEQYYRGYTFPITNIKVIGHEYETETRDYDKMIRIGDPSVWLTGEQHYTIQYQMHTKELDVPGMGDLFYLNIIGNKWGTKVEHLSFTITFLKQVDFDNWSLTSGYQGNDTNDHMSCQVIKEGYTMKCNSFQALDAYQSVTVTQRLGENYFQFPDYTMAYIASLAGSAGLLGLVAFLFLRYGKDEKIVQTVEFTAPQGLNSASVGYIIDDKVETRDVVSLILEWAKERYINIVEEEKSELILIKLKEITESSGSRNRDKPTYEVRMFNALFGGKDEVKISSLKYKFASEIAHAQSGVKHDFVKGDRRIYTAKSIGLKNLVILLAPIPLALTYAVVSHSQHYTSEATIGGFIIAYVIGIFVSLVLVYGLNSMGSGKTKLLNYLVFGSITAVAILGMLLLLSDGFEGDRFIYLGASVLMTLGISFLGAFMDKRTAFGARVYGQVLGLRNFIVTAEKERLKLLVEDNPMIFYDILPYAYAFDLTKIWAKHFKNLEIPEPEYYTSVSGRTFSPNLFTSSMNKSMGTITRNLTSVPPSTSSSGGGSFSSGGGSSGGSSGGGFGGGGGGRW
jgi:Beta-propeller domains of methanol dehydrogenase type